MNYLHTEAPLVIIHRDLKPANILMSPTEKSARTPSGYTLKVHLIIYSKKKKTLTK